MTIIFMFLFVLILLMIIRTIKINYRSNRQNKVDSNKYKVFIRVINFIKKEVRFLIYMYVGLVGLYVLSKRMLKYNIYPANLKEVNHILSIIHDMNTNEFISFAYLSMLSVYGPYILSYRLVKFYNNTIKDIHCKDYIHEFIVNNFSKLENKIKNDKN